MTYVNCLEELAEAEGLLLEIRHNLTFRPTATMESTQRDIARAKAIIDAADLLFNPKPPEEPQPQLHLPNVMRGQSPEPLALLEQELNRAMQIPATIQTANYFEKIRRISDVQKAMALIGELQQKANGA